MSHRTITEILVDADNSESPWQVDKLRMEIADNTYYYSLVQLEFAIEHLQEARVRVLKQTV